MQIALTVGISSASVQTYLDLWRENSFQSHLRARLEEIELIGAEHYEARDAEKGGPSRGASTRSERRRRCKSN